MRIKNENRSLYYDNIKGFLILLVVFAHCLYNIQHIPIANIITDAIYMFHMPAFVFVSGYFGKSENSGSFKSSIKLLFLYFVFNSITGFIYGFNSLLEPLYSYWYLIALCVWRIITPKISKFKEIMLILFAVSVFAGFYSSIDNTFAISRIISFYPYYMAGYLLSKEKSDELEKKKYSKRFAFGLLFVLGAVVIGAVAYKIFEYSDSALLMFSYSHPKDAFGRIFLYIVAFLAIYALRYLSIDKKIPLLTSFGKNSLAIFLFHRPFTLIFSDYYRFFGNFLIPSAVAVTVLICLVFGNDYVSNSINYVSNGFVGIFDKENAKKSTSKTIASVIALSVAVCFVGEIVVRYYKNYVFVYEEETETVMQNEDEIYRVMSKADERKFDSALRITFAGDLILLEDQVKLGYKDGKYSFDDVFEYARPHIESADLAIGVFEGPMAGKDEGYSSSNYDDGKTLALNYPDEFAVAVKNAGFDLVTTANNHLLDKGISGAKRTVDILNKIGIEHIGSYKNADEKEKENVRLVEVDGIKFAVLAYTYGTNMMARDELAFGESSYLTSVIYGTEGEEFEKLKENVRKDFEKAKALEPDFIIVLPHIGTQFSNQPDEEQEGWFEVFKEYGADIILGDHTHVVEPVKIESYNGRNVFICYCPGNFANIYRENQGDTSMLIDVYIDKSAKKVIGGGIVPLYTKAQLDGNYSAIPIYDIMNNDKLKSMFSTDDFERAKESYNIITSVALGINPDISGVTESLIFDENGYVRTKTRGLDMTEKMKSGKFFKELSMSESVCFIGDSVTEGTKNGGCPWYEPLEEYINADISAFAKGGATIRYIIDNSDNIPNAELYVIAIGTNDVRYRDSEICAMTSDDFINSIQTLKEIIKVKNPSARFIFIAPWYSTDGDKVSVLSFEEKTRLNDEYCSALEKYAKQNNDIFINPNGYIKEKLYENPQSRYLLDHIHPNANEGVIMYCEAVLSE